MQNGASQEPVKKTPWYFTTTCLLIALLSVGPLALPLLWFNPRHSAAQKWLWTVATVALTYALFVVSVATFKTAMQQAKDLGLIK